eukprot:scaffold13049_cov122-Isochrysis_galbana.AAC.2
MEATGADRRPTPTPKRPRAVSDAALRTRRTRTRRTPQDASHFGLRPAHGRYAHERILRIRA